MRFSRLVNLMVAFGIVLAVAGSATALAVSREQDLGMTAPVTLSGTDSVTSGPEGAAATGRAAEPGPKDRPDPASTLPKNVLPETGFPRKAAAPPGSPAGPFLVKTGPAGADAVLKTVDSPYPPESPNLQVNAAASAARNQAVDGRNGAQPVFQQAEVTSFDITLSPGANLISLPLIPEDRDIEAVLGAILPRVETVWHYDTSAPAPRWRSYAPGAPSDLRVMRDGPGYWVLLKDGGAGEVVLTITGREDTGPARRVARGWNLVGFTATSPQAPGEYLGTLSGMVGAMVGYSGGAAAPVLPSSTPPQLMPGRGYWLYLEEAGAIGGAPPATMVVPAERQGMVEVVHGSGAKIEIPPGATAGALGADSAETVTVSIQRIDPPGESILPLGQVFDFSIVDQEGRDVPLREAVKVTLPYTLPADKNAADVTMLHWDEARRRWETAGGSAGEAGPGTRATVAGKPADGGQRAKGGRVDETSGTITAEVEHLSDYAVSLFLAPVEYMAVSGLSVMGRELFRPTYDAGYKHLISLDGSASLPIPHAPNITVGELGFSLILDLDDAVSLPTVWDDVQDLVDDESSVTGIQTPEGITAEGIAGYFTYGLNANVALSVQAGANPLPVSGGIRFRLPLTEEYGTTGFNNDVSFEASASALTLSFPYVGEVSAVTFNQNGNIDPTNAQLGTCLACTSSLEVQATLADITFNITKGEFNTGFLEEIADKLLDVDQKCSAPGSQCQIPAQGFSDVWIEHLYGSFAKVLEGVAEYLGIIARYTPYEHTSPDPENPRFAAGYTNGVEKVAGGHDVNGDGRGDMVFPAGSAGGIPLQIWTTGDSHENRKYFLELYDLTEGWEIALDAAKWHESLKPEMNPPSEDALWRVDFETLALSANQTHWLVTAADDAPNLGKASFRLVHNRSLLEGGTDMKVDDATINLVKDRDLTDLSVEVAVSHDPVASGETLTYTVTVRNEGPDAADGVELHLNNAVMHGLVLTGASASGRATPSCSESTAAVGYACRLGNLGAREATVVTLRFELGVRLADGETFRTLFAVMSHTDDLALENNSATSNSTVRAPDREALAAVYRTTDGRNWSYQRDWLSGEPIGDWYGVTTDDIGRVTDLDLYQNRLTGAIPAELGSLPSLKRLHLTGNRLSGPIPGELGDLTQLEQLSAGSNRLIGEMPPELGSLGNLTRLHLSDNQLTGGIPDWLGSLSGLERLSLSRNQLTGEIPPELARLPNLQFLRLQGNRLTGCIPEGLREVPDNDLAELGLSFCLAGAFARNPAEDFNTLDAAGNDSPRGVWSDGETMWVLDWVDNKIYAYAVTTKARVADKDFDTLVSEGRDGRGIWSDGETMWVVGRNDADKIYAYDMMTKGRVPSKDFDTLSGNRQSEGILSDGDTMWVSDLKDHKIYAYDMTTKSRVPGKDIPILGDVGNERPLGMWADVATLWVVDHVDDKIYAYNKMPIVRVIDKEFDTLALAGNNAPWGIWSNGDTMWVSDMEDAKIYAYNMPTVPAGDAATDRAALVALYNATDGANWNNKGRWLSNAPTAQWYGVLTNSDGRVTGLYLDNNQLSGEIPAELGSLSSLRTLSLNGNPLSGGNQLSGEIPAELGNLSSLERLRLHNNQLSGEIPPELGNLTNLELLYLHENQLSGEIPVELGSLSRLGRLRLFGNQLSGEIPAELGSLSSIRELSLGGNQLSGEIPAELGSLSSIRELGLNHNQLSGEIPVELGGLTNLVWLTLSNNQLTGEIPAELGSLSSLRQLLLNHNHLSGEIPVELGGLTNLEWLWLGNNQLSGEIPAELGSLSSLRQLWLNHNQLSGEIPAELGNLTSLEWLWLSNNQLVGCIPSGLRNLNLLTHDLQQLGLPFCGN